MLGTNTVSNFNWTPVVLQAKMKLLHYIDNDIILPVVSSHAWDSENRGPNLPLLFKVKVFRLN